MPATVRGGGMKDSNSVGRMDLKRRGRKKKEKR
jgi:hypothetical protein